ncbi:prepilin-type N-terminal cleavage/methylation domain-containing protein [Stenotrophomonas sp. CFBP8980]|uniref:prepilin-type N-terminal cleavage/methylation domain-containing protein n=1 Tax=Stenotrophomonas sp. CFBP8980 TaxID=3096523 RepID=UPI002A6B7C42|nr:prepilin-type N-terminal cleavage/methylation domain-containing protein [Stenotrophomonas sp. CFBP8980]MDY1033766.1 prepilin-type N-terminal cleavage/methylation domain-containing protein [Stenotrophomonas sp. CFBP8980]
MNHRASGFTLIEVLLATALLAAGLALAFVTVRSAMTISQRGEAIAADNERMRAVQGLLRRQLSQALRSRIEPADPAREPVYFIGEAQRLRFVSEVPGYLGRGGSYVHDLQVVRSGQGVRLQLGLVMVQDGMQIQERPPRAPEPLADGLRQVTLRYRGRDETSGQLSDWVDAWPDTRRPPLLVSVQVQPLRGPAWPELRVALENSGQEQAR